MGREDWGRNQRLEHRNLIAALKLWAAHTIPPCLERQFSFFYLSKADLLKELGHVSESEYRLQFVYDGFLLQARYDDPPDPIRFLGRLDGERPYFSRRRRIEMERGTAN